MYLKKDEILLRDFEERDIDDKIKWINDSRNNAFLHYNIPLNFNETLNWYKNKSKISRIDCIIEYNEVPVGLIGLLEIDKKSNKAEMYITIGNTEFKRKGIAFKSINMILEYAFNELSLNKIYLNVDAENIPACSLYEKVGFIQEGYFSQDLMHRNKLIDRKRYAVIKDNYCKGENK